MRKGTAERENVLVQRSADGVPKKKSSGFTSSSFNVFMRHTSQPSGQDASNVLTRACFLDWLSTRPHRNIKYPASSFQRVLYAHIRGADNRKPFPEAVEKDLLRRLRDKDNNPWLEMFPEETWAIGKRRFKKLGFHESLKLKNQRKSKQKLDFVDQLERPVDVPSYEVEKFDFEKEFETFGDNEYFQYSLKNCVKNRTTTWDLLIASIQINIPVSHRKAGLVVGKERGFQFWSHALYMFLTEARNPTDWRSSWEFLCPSENIQEFRNDRPVGRIVVSSANQIIRENESALKILGGSGMNHYYLEIFASSLSLCNMFLATSPSLYKGKGLCWQRNVLKRKDKSLVVCLMFVLYTGSEKIVLFQDHSDFFPEIVSSRYFI